jgi:hypothetical protein
VLEAIPEIAGKGRTGEEEQKIEHGDCIAEAANGGRFQQADAFRL